MFLFVSIVIHAQNLTKYVAAKSGLIIRDKPSADGEIIDVLDFNEKVGIESNLHLDTIQYRVANWHRIRVDSSNVSGYVFGGYLNRKPLPDFEYSSLRIFMNHLIESYEVEYEIKREGEESLKFQNRSIRIQGSVNHLLVHDYGYEWKNVELNLFDWSLYEIINIIEIATWFDEKKEYEIFEESIKDNNLEEFMWINAFDDPEGVMVLESRYPIGVRIIESSSL
jgi:hypothetical protein